MNTMNSIALHPPDARILPAVLKLVVLRMRISYNGFRHAKLRTKIRNIFVWTVLLGFAYFILSASRWVLSLLRSPEFAQYVSIDLHSILALHPRPDVDGLVRDDHADQFRRLVAGNVSCR